MRDSDSTPPTVGQLGDDAELLLVLARIVEGKAVSRAFGAPGDWGYNTPIGRALAASGAEGRPLSNFMGIAGDQSRNSGGST